MSRQAKPLIQCILIYTIPPILITKSKVLHLKSSLLLLSQSCDVEVRGKVSCLRCEHTSLLLPNLLKAVIDGFACFRSQNGHLLDLIGIQGYFECCIRKLNVSW